MKHRITYLLIAATAMLTACRSQQASTLSGDTTAVPTTFTPETADTQQPESSLSENWDNIYMPVKVELLQPKQYSLSGRATMVRDSLVWVSMRFFGFEVGTAYADNQQGCVTLKQPQKLALEVDLQPIMQKYGFNITDLQNALLGNEEALSKLPPEVTRSVDQQTSGKVVINLSTVQSGKTVSLRLTCDLNSAEINSTTVRQWSAPSSAYKFITPATALKALEQL